MSAVLAARLSTGQVQVMSGDLSTLMPQVKAGKLRALAVTTPARSSQMPEVPTLQEAGVACLDGRGFGEFGEGYLRFSYANSMDNIQEALRRIKALSAKWAK